ncbi:hypothetical protein [Halomicrococcus gelatinilyticus]|uniref:hypothetical protein n=1 Tax=Halomicrococcus gelatinilyticus TaxID=1702103 RepID=UPI002E12B7A2
MAEYGTPGPRKQEGIDVIRLVMGVVWVVAGGLSLLAASLLVSEFGSGITITGRAMSGLFFAALLVAVVVLAWWME